MELEIVAGALLAEDDTPLAVDCGWIELDLAGDLAEQEHRRVDVLVVCLGQVEHIGRRVESRYRVRVRSECKTLALQDFHHVALGHVSGPVESHMFDEVRKTTFVLGLADRSECELKPHRGRALRRRVAHDRVLHAVGEGAVLDRWVRSDVREVNSPAIDRRFRGRRDGSGSRRAPGENGDGNGRAADAR